MFHSHEGLRKDVGQLRFALVTALSFLDSLWNHPVISDGYHSEITRYCCDLELLEVLHLISCGLVLLHCSLYSFVLY